MYNKLVDESPISQSIVDLETRELIYANKTLRAQIGVTCPKQKLYVSDIHSPDEIAWCEKETQESLLNEGIWEGNLKASFPKAENKAIALFASRKIYKLNGKDICLCSMVNKTTEEERKNTIERFKVLHDLSEHYFFIASRQNHEIIYRNKKAEELLPAKNNEKTYINNYHNSQEMAHIKNVILPALTENKKWTGPLNLTIKNKKTIFAYISAVSYIDSTNNNEFIYASFIDISKQKILEQQQRNHNEQFNRVMRLSLAAEISSGIAHQISQPLAVISSTLQQWQASNSKYFSNNMRNKLTRIVESSLDMGNTIHCINELLTCKENNRKDNISTGDICIRIKRHYNDKYNNIDIIIISLVENMVVSFNGTLLELSLQNLINNAIESTPNDKKFKVYLMLSHEKNRINIRVCDNGMGIPKELHKKIFEPFYTTKTDGTGTGLSLLLRLKEYHDLDIYYDDSYVTKEFNYTGSCFCLSIPVAQNLKNAITNEVQEKCEI